MIINSNQLSGGESYMSETWVLANTVRENFSVSHLDAIFRSNGVSYDRITIQNSYKHAVSNEYTKSGKFDGEVLITYYATLTTTKTSQVTFNNSTNNFSSVVFSVSKSTSKKWEALTKDYVYPTNAEVDAVAWPAYDFNSEYFKTLNFYKLSPEGDFLVWLEANATKQTT